MSLNTRRFSDWVERRMLSPGDIARSFAVFHIGKIGPALVGKLSPITDASPDDIAHQLAKEVETEAHDHVEAWPGRQQYVVRAYAEGSREVGEFAFSMVANSITHTHAASSLLDPTPEQVVYGSYQTPGAESENAALGSSIAMLGMQQMRQNEALVRYVVEMSANQQERNTQIIQSQQKAIDKFQARHMEMFELLETMRSKQAERDIENQKYEDDRERKERLLNRLNTLVIPALAKRAGLAGLMGSAGGDGSNGSNGASSEEDQSMVAKIRHIFLTLPDDMQNQFVGALSDEDRDSLLSIFERKETESTSETKH